MNKKSLDNMLRDTRKRSRRRDIKMVGASKLEFFTDGHRGRIQGKSYITDGSGYRAYAWLDKFILLNKRGIFTPEEIAEKFGKKDEDC